MKTITAMDYQIAFLENGYLALNEHLANSDYSLIFLLVDPHTHKHCLPHFLSRVETRTTIEIIEIDAGEEHKNLETCNGVWEALSELGADRKSLIINLGGGVITDLGGFVACTFKRGMDYINVPTSLLAMVDASVGGKTGVDLGALKNQIGVIGNPCMVLVDTRFLATLPREELRSGYAEMLKHGLITGRGYWEQVRATSFWDLDGLGELIHGSITIKNEVVLQDPREQGLRKALNFGHTLGHAIESYFLPQGGAKKLLHGEAIAIGMILAAYLSKEICGLEQEELNAISWSIVEAYSPVHFTEQDIDQVIRLLKFDKKNSHGKVYFVLLKEIGRPIFNQEVSNDLIYSAFDFYEKIVQENDK